MRYLYTENEPIERHPIRYIGDCIVVINKKTGLPEIGKVWITGEVILFLEGRSFIASPYYWEIAWP